MTVSLSPFVLGGGGWWMSQPSLAILSSTTWFTGENEIWEPIFWFNSSSGIIKNLYGNSVENCVLGWLYSWTGAWRLAPRSLVENRTTDWLDDRPKLAPPSPKGWSCSVHFHTQPHHFVCTLHLTEVKSCTGAQFRHRRCVQLSELCWCVCTTALE